MVRTKVFSLMVFLLVGAYWVNFFVNDGNIEDVKKINKRIELKVDE